MYSRIDLIERGLSDKRANSNEHNKALHWQAATRQLARRAWQSSVQASQHTSPCDDAVEVEVEDEGLRTKMKRATTYQGRDRGHTKQQLPGSSRCGEPDSRNQSRNQSPTRRELGNRLEARWFLQVQHHEIKVGSVGNENELPN